MPHAMEPSVIAHDGPPRDFDGGAWTRGFTMDRDHAEPRGYLAATQTPVPSPNSPEFGSMWRSYVKPVIM